MPGRGGGRAPAFLPKPFSHSKTALGGRYFPILLVHVEYFCTWSSKKGDITPTPSIVFAWENSLGWEAGTFSVPTVVFQAHLGTPFLLKAIPWSCCVAAGNLRWIQGTQTNTLKTQMCNLALCELGQK